MLYLLYNNIWSFHTSDRLDPYRCLAGQQIPGLYDDRHALEIVLPGESRTV